MFEPAGAKKVSLQCLFSHGCSQVAPVVDVKARGRLDTTTVPKNDENCK